MTQTPGDSQHPSMTTDSRPLDPNSVPHSATTTSDAGHDATKTPSASHRHDLSHLLFTTSKPGTAIKKQISYIAPGQTAKALMLIYLTFSVPIVLLAILVGFLRYGDMQISSVARVIFSALILNAIVGFILLWIACQAYNWVASRFGGIEITLSDTPEDV